MSNKKYRLTLKVISPHWLRFPDGRSLAFSASVTSHEVELSDSDVRDLESTGYQVEELSNVGAALDAIFPGEDEGDEEIESLNDDELEGE